MDGLSADPVSTEKLTKIFQAFLKGNLPKDDTMIEKFGGLLKKELSNSLDTSILVDCLQQLNQQASPHPQTVAFFLKAASHMSLRPGSELTTHTWSLYRKVADCDLWTTAAVRCAWLTGLCNMASSLQASKLVTEWLKHEEYGFKFFNALTDSSLFVAKASMELASVLLSSAMNEGVQSGSKFEQENETEASEEQSCSSENSENKDVQEISCEPQELLERFWNLIHKCKAEGSSLRLALLTVLEKVASAGSTSLLEIIYHKNKLCDVLCPTLKPKEGKVPDTERNVCLQILKYCGGVLTAEDIEKYEELSKVLLYSGDVKTAMFLASWLLTCHEDKVKQKNSMKDVVFAVISLTASSDSEQQNLAGIHQQILNQSKSFLRLILAQLDVMRTYHNTQDIPVAYLHGMVDLFCGLGFRSSGLLMDKVKGKEVAFKHNLLDTFNHIFQVRPAARNKPVMVRLVMSCYAEVVQPIPVNLIQKTLKTMLVSIVYLTCSVEFDKEQAAFVQKMKDIGWNMSDSLFPPQNEDYTEENPGPMIDEVLSTWPMVICTGKRLLTDTRWEVVDSVIELLTEVLIQMKGVSMIQKGFYKTEFGALDRSIIHNMEHPESYVRASSVQCVAAMATIPGIWEHLIESHPKDEMLRKIIDLARNDSEAFGRRSAVHVLTVFYSIDCYKTNQPEIVNVMRQLMKDLDWEVKQNVLEFWRKYIAALDQGIKSDDSSTSNSSTSTPKENDLMGALVSSGCLKSLLQAAHDCDKVVQETACKMLQPIKHIISEEPNSKKPRMSGDTSDVLPCGTDDADIPDHSSDLLGELAELDLESLLHVSTLSTDQYDLRPEALLDDLLSSVMPACVDTCSAEDGQEDNAIDCY